VEGQTDMRSLEIYREKVREAILRRDGVPLLNGDVDHASIVVQEVLSNAKNRVRILSHRLDPDCYAKEAVRNAAAFFLADPDHSLEVLIEAYLWDDNNNFQWDKHPLISDLKKCDNKQVQVRLVPKDWSDGYNFNFMLLDDYGYRFESDRARAAAVVAFLPNNGEKTVKHLGGIFEQLWDESKPLPLS
jgi:hypothetical protein